MFIKNTKDKILYALSLFVEKYPYPIFIASILLALVSIHFAKNNLNFLTNRNDLISPHAQYFKNYKKYREEFKDFDGLVIAVEGSNKERVKAFVEDLAFFLNSHPEKFEDVFYKISPDFFKNKKLLYLDVEELHTLENKVKSNKTLLANLVEKPGIEQFFSHVNQEISKAMVGNLIQDFFDEKDSDGQKEPDNPLDLSLIESILGQMVNHLNGQENYSSPWKDVFLEKKGSVDEDGYLTSNGKHFYFIFANPSEDQNDFARAVDPIKSARNHIKKLQLKYPDVLAGVTGPTALYSDEMITSKNDTFKASLISLIGVSVLLVISLRGFTFPFLAVFTLVISLCWSIGFTTLTVGHLSILSIVFTTILIGLGIDFGIHFIMRYQEEKRSGQTLSNAITKTLHETGKGVIAGGITTSFAFMTTIFADFKGIAELGFIAGSGIIICLIATMLLLPAMIIIVQHLHNKQWIMGLINKIAFDYNISNKTIRPLFDLILNKPGRVILFSIVITFLSILSMKTIKFDYNLLNLQAEGIESVNYEMKILENSERSAWYGALIVNSFEEVLSTKKLLERLSSVDSVSSIASIIPDRQEEKINQIHKISDFFKQLPQKTMKEDPVDVENLATILKKINFKLRKEDSSNLKPGSKPLNESIQKVKRLIADFNSFVNLQEIKTSATGLNNFQEILFGDFIRKFESFKEALKPVEIKLSNVPNDIKERFVGKTGKFLVQVFPKATTYDKEPMEKFISDISKIDPNATGTVVTATESSRLMKQGYVRGGIYAFIAITIFVWISFKDIRCAFLAILPLMLGALWTLGIMGLFNIQFNLANLIILPLIIGIGIDNGIHIVHRYRDDADSTISPVYKSTGKAVALSSFTTMIGFGSLMVASHRGIHSIGVLLTIGVACCMVASLTVLPAILKITREKGWNPKNT